MVGMDAVIVYFIQEGVSSVPTQSISDIPSTYKSTPNPTKKTTPLEIGVCVLSILIGAFILTRK